MTGRSARTLVLAVVGAASVGCGGANVDVNVLVRLASGLGVRFDDAKRDAVVDAVTADGPLVDAVALDEPVRVNAPGPAVFEVNFTQEVGGETEVLGIGRSGVIALAGDAVDVPILVGRPNSVVEADPSPEFFAGACTAVDEAGRVFVVGGANNLQGVYEYSDAFSVVIRDDSAASGKQDLGCSAGGGTVFFVGGCVGDAVDIVDVGARRRVPVPGGAACGATVARRANEYYYIAADRTLRLSSDGTELSASGGIADVKNVIVDGDNRVMVAAGGRLLDISNGVLNLAASDVLGRRGTEVFGLAGARLVDRSGAGIRADVSLSATPVAFAVLADDTVAAIVGGNLEISPPGGTRVTRPLNAPHTAIGVLDGDTLVLGGGGGFSVFVFASRDLFAR